MKTIASIICALIASTSFGAAVDALSLQARLQAADSRRLASSFLSFQERVDLKQDLDATASTNGVGNSPSNARVIQFQAKLSSTDDARVRSRIFGAIMEELRRDPVANAEAISNQTAEAIKGPLFDLDAFQIAWTNAEARRGSGSNLSTKAKLDVTRLYVTALNILARQPGGLAQVEIPGSIVNTGPASPEWIALAQRRQQEIEQLRDHNDMAIYAPWIIGKVRSLYNDGKNETIDRALKDAGASPEVEAAIPRAPLNIDEREALQRAKDPNARAGK